jgi:flagellar motor switch protein FliN
MSELFSSSMDQMSSFSDTSDTKVQDNKNLDLLMDVMLQVVVELGRTKMPLRQILDLQQGSVVELDRQAGEAVDLYVNDRLIARGEVVMVDDKFGVRITEMVTNKGGDSK